MKELNKARENVHNIIGNLDNTVRKQINAIARVSGLQDNSY